jgi:V/A-type H+-transporting ATPase subunit E
MGLGHVKDGILAEARSQSDQELARAREEAKAIRARAEQRAQELRGARQHETQAAAQALRRRELALAELEAKKLRLQAEKELLGQVRTTALQRLAGLPAGTNEQYLSALVKRAAIQDPKVHARPQDQPLVERMGLKYAGPVEAVGGVVVESADGLTREDLRYEDILEDAWRDALGDVAQRLFGNR